MSDCRAEAHLHIDVFGLKEVAELFMICELPHFWLADLKTDERRDDDAVAKRIGIFFTCGVNLITLYGKNAMMLPETRNCSLLRQSTYSKERNR